MRREPTLKAPFRGEALSTAAVGEADVVDAAEAMNLGLAQAGTRRQGFDDGDHVFAEREPRENPPRQKRGSPQAPDRPRGKRRRAPERRCCREHRLGAPTHAAISAPRNSKINTPINRVKNAA